MYCNFYWHLIDRTGGSLDDLAGVPYSTAQAVSFGESFWLIGLAGFS